MRPQRTHHPSRLAWLAIAATLAGGTSLALAHSGATGVVKERMELMKSIGESMKTLTRMFKGERDYHPEQARLAAARIRDHADKIAGLFPEGSLDKPSEALPAIWQDWPAFQALTNQLAAYSAALVEAADNPSGAGAVTGQSMMGQDQGLTDQGRGMMGGGMTGEGGGPSPELLARMPPQAAFTQLARTCNACHTRFRMKKD